MKASKFQFRNPELRNLKFSINEDFSQEVADDLKLASKTNVKKNADNSEAYVTFLMEIGEVANSQPFYIEIQMGSLFSWDKDIDEEVLQGLLKSNAPAVLLSYMRPIIASLTSNSRYPTLNIPFLDLSKNEIEE